MGKITYKTRSFQIKVFSVLIFILLLLVGFYLYRNGTTLLEYKKEIALNNELHFSLLEQEARLQSEFDSVRDANIELNQTILSEKEIVLPLSQNLTSLTRQLENYASSIHRTKNPFRITNLQYQNVLDVDEKDYKVLPFNMTLHSSYDNFYKFLNYIENSGTLSDKSRLLDLRQIVINFVSPRGSQGNLSGQDEINFNVLIYAYFRP